MCMKTYVLSNKHMWSHLPIRTYDPVSIFIVDIIYVMQIYIIMVIQMVIWYNITLMHGMVMIKYCNIIIIIFLIDYYIFGFFTSWVLLWSNSHWMFFHLIIIFRGFSPHRLFIFSNFSWLVMCLGFIGSLLTWLTHSLCLGHWDHIKVRARCCSGTDWFSIYRDITSSRVEEAK